MLSKIESQIDFLQTCSTHQSFNFMGAFTSQPAKCYKQIVKEFKLSSSRKSWTFYEKLCRLPFVLFRVPGYRLQDWEHMRCLASLIYYWRFFLTSHKSMIRKTNLIRLDSWQILIESLSSLLIEEEGFRVRCSASYFCCWLWTLDVNNVCGHSNDCDNLCCKGHFPQSKTRKMTFIIQAQGEWLISQAAPGLLFISSQEVINFCSRSLETLRFNLNRWPLNKWHQFHFQFQGFFYLFIHALRNN